MTLKNLKCEILYVCDCEYINIASFAVSDIKLWLEEDSDLDTDHPFVFIQIHSMSSFSHSLISNKANLKTFVYAQSAIIRVQFPKI